MTRLSVNINKIATLRNARGHNLPDVTKVALDCERFGAQGITVHPRPDERHIKRTDVYALKNLVTTEFNIEGYPSDDFMALVCEVKPHQVTLVPDPPDVLTSNNGWDCKENLSFLQEVIFRLKEKDIRTSIFLNPDIHQVEFAARTGTHRIELYTEAYAAGYATNRETAIKKYTETALLASQNGLGINAGHDLNLQNLTYLVQQIPFIDEVSIGHALICDALYFGLQNTIQMYLHCLKG